MIERRSRRTEGGATWIWGVTMSLAPEIRVEQVGEGASRVDGDLLAPVSPTALHLADGSPQGAGPFQHRLFSLPCLRQRADPHGRSGHPSSDALSVFQCITASLLVVRIEKPPCGEFDGRTNKSQCNRHARFLSKRI